MSFLQDDIEENIDEFQFNSLDEIQDSEEIRKTVVYLISVVKVLRLAQKHQKKDGMEVLVLKGLQRKALYGSILMRRQILIVLVRL
jgi:hypothetical protein